jgi:hypothetical protein
MLSSILTVQRQRGHHAVVFAQFVPFPTISDIADGKI